MDISLFANLEPHIRAAMDAAPDAMSVFTLEGRFVNCNPAAVTMHGAAGRSDLIGKNVLDFIAPESLPEATACMRTLVAGEKDAATLTYQLMRPDGTQIPVEATSTLIRDEKNHPIGFYCITRDISEHLKADARLRDSEEKYRFLVENTQDGICIVQDFRYVFTNPRFLESLGYEPREGTHLELSDLHEGDDLARAKETIRGILEGRLPIRPREYQMRRRNGEWFPVEIISVPIIYNGRPAIHSVMRDITDRKRRQEEEVHRVALEKEIERLREVNQIKTEFLSMVSHELRTPISVMLGILEVALSGQFGELTAKTRDRLGVAYRRGRQLANLINDLLDLASVESGRLNLRPELVTIEEQIIILTDSFAERARKKNIELLFDNRSTHRTFVTDRDRFMQILFNLADNALKFTPHGGRISVRASDAGLHDMQFEVSDTGIGIPEHLRERVFERFFQVDGRDTRQYGGTGLGLSIVRELTQLLGGKIEIHGAENGGTTVTFTLPRFARPVSPGPAEGPYRLPTLDRPYLFLVIDDDPDFAGLIEDTYGKSACKVHAATSGVAGLEILSREPADLLLLDLMMPDMDGFEVCRRLRAGPRTEKLPILAISAFGQTGTADQALAAGCDDFLSKPFDMQQLHTKIIRLLGT